MLLILKKLNFIEKIGMKVAPVRVHLILVELFSTPACSTNHSLTHNMSALTYLLYTFISSVVSLRFVRTIKIDFTYESSKNCDHNKINSLIVLTDYQLLSIRQFKKKLFILI